MATEALVLARVAPPATALSDSAALTSATRSRIPIGGVLIDRVDWNVAAERIRTFSRSGRAHQIVTVNLDFLAIAERDAAFRATVNNADLAVPDGMPLVWLSRLTGEPLRERVAGVELVYECCRLAAETDQGVFLLGAGPGVADSAARVLEDRYPGLRVVGAYSPSFGPLTPTEDAHIVDMVNAARPGFLFVALGAPRQDLWIRAHLDQLKVPVSMGVGCVLDLVAGELSRAPMWMQRSGLEWAYRLAKEPGRLWRRYLMDDVPLLARLMGAMLLRSPAAETPGSLGSATL